MKQFYTPKKFKFFIFSFLLFFTAINYGQNFSQSNLNFNGLGSVDQVTSLKFGPDGRLYISEYSGLVKVLTIQRTGNNMYTVTNMETLTGIKTIPNHNDDGSPDSSTSRETTGLTVAGTAANPIIYVTSSDFRIGGGPSKGDVNLDTNSGIITRFTWNGSSWDVVDIVRGLSRSEENHGTHGLEFVTVNNKKYLIVTSGGHTNAGSPSTNFTYLSEYALSAAILSVDLDQLETMPIQTSNNRNFIYDIPTLDDPTRPNIDGIEDPNDPNYTGIDVNDPFGGNDGLNQAKIVAGGPVQIFSPGYRNAYDLVVTESGAVYATDNGANGGWGGFPINEGTPNVTNNYDPSEPGSSVAAPDGEKVNNLDHLQLITTNIQNYAFGSYYGGHPNPTRANPSAAGLFTAPATHGLTGAFFRTQVYNPNALEAGYTSDPNIALPADWPPVPSIDGIPVSNTVEGDWRGPNTNNPDGPNDNAVVIMATNTNGIDEYTASNFGGAMKGNLLAGTNTGILRRIELKPDGTLKKYTASFASGLGGNVLGVTCNSDLDIFPGTIWLGTFNSDIKILEPQDFIACLNPGDVGYDANADYDNDGYTNQDEIDNLTDPCNGGSQPNDFNKSVGGILISDLNDPDDDSDGIPDALDPFQLGNPNVVGSDAFNIPVINELFSDTSLGGYLGLGMTGIMNNGDTGANWLNWLDRRDDPNDPNPNDILGGAIGAMTMQMTSGTALGTINNQEKGFQYGVITDINTGTFIVSGAMVNFYQPLQLYGNVDTPDSELGFFIGDGTQSNYIKFVARPQGLRVQQEIDDIPQPPIDLLIEEENRPASSIRFTFIVDSSTGEILLEYSFDNEDSQTLGSITAQGAILQAIQETSSELAVGFIGTSNAPNKEVEGTWGYLNVTSTVLNTIIANAIPNQLNYIEDTLNPEVTVVASGGDGNLSFTANNLPPGLVINASTGVISGTINQTASINNPYNVTITIDDSDSDTEDIVVLNFTWTVQQNPNSFDYVLFARVNAGGTVTTATDGSNVNWAANTATGAFSGTNYSVNTGVPYAGTGITGVTRHASIPDYIDQATFNKIFATERYDAAEAPEMQFTFPVTSAHYLVNIYLSNRFANTSQPGQRVFGIAIEGAIVKSNLDLITEFGHLAAGMLSFPVTVTDGALDIEFLHGLANNPLVNAIEILKSSNVNAILINPIANQTNNPEDVIDLSVIATGGNGDLSFLATGLPSGLSIDPLTGNISGTIGAGAETYSPYDVTITVDDSDGDPSNAASISFIWNVINGNPIVTTPIPDQSNNVGDALNGSLVVSATGGDGNLSFTASNLPPGVSIDPTNGLIGGVIEDGAETNSPYNVTITIDDNDGDDTDVITLNFTWTIEDNSNASDYVPFARVNAGGTVTTATDGSNVNWAANTATGAFSDTSYSVNTGVPFPGTGITGVTRHASIPDYIDQATFNKIFATERYDAVEAPEMQFTFPVPSAHYLVNIYLSNRFANTSQPGQRVFGIAIEGAIVKSNLDLITEFGHLAAGMLSFPVTVTDGALDIEFLHGLANNPLVNAIEILKSSNANTIFVNTIANQTNNPGDIIDLSVIAIGGNGDLSFSETGLPSGLSIDPLTGNISGTIGIGSETYSPYDVTVTVDDNDGDPSNAASVNFVWNVIANQAPVAVASATPLTGEAPLYVTFTGNESTDDNNDIVSYEWDFGNGDSATGVNSNYTFTEPGTYDVTLTVTDGAGIKDTETIVIFVGTSTPCEWNNLASSSLEKVESQSAKVGDKLYVMAGFMSGLIITGATEIYDSNTNVWSTGAPMPLPVTHMGIAVVGTDIWIISGFVGNNPGTATAKVQIYNTVLDSWSYGPDLPAPRGSGAATFNNGKIHYFGGLLPDRVTDVGEHYILDVNNQGLGWIAASELPNPRNHLSAASINGLVYAIGGQYGHDNGVQDQNFLDVYNPDTDVWTRLANLPSARSHFEPGTIVHNGKIIIVGGRQGNFFFDDITEYNPITNEWSEKCKLPEKLLAPAAKVFGSKLIVTNGGVNGTNFPTDSARWIYINPEIQFPPLSLDPISDQSNKIGETNSLILFAQGGNPNENITYSLSGQPSGINVNPTNGEITGSIEPIALTGGVNNDGVHLVTVTASKPGSVDVTQQFNWTITPDNMLWHDKNENENYTARHECSFVQAGDKFYLMGGRENAKTLDVYDYTTNSWVSLVNSVPGDFNHFQATEYQGLIWVIGAFKTNVFPSEVPADYIWSFNPATQEWIQGPEIPAARRRGSAGLVVYNDKFYIVGGNTIGHNGGYVAWFDEYDPATGIWTPLVNAPRARDHFHAMVIGDKLYAAGGRLSGGAGGTFKPVIPQVDVFDFTLGTWSTLPVNLPTPRAAPSVANYNGKLMVIGGEVENELVYGVNTTDALKITEAYDPSTGAWTRLPDLNHDRHGTQAIVSGDGVFLLGGSPNKGGGNQKNMEYYGTDNPSGNPSIASSITGPTEEVIVNENSASNITLNVAGGNIGISIKSMTISGTNANGFEITSGKLTNGFIKPDSSHSLNITYTGSINNALANLIINYGANSTLNIPLRSMVTSTPCVDVNFSAINNFTNRNIPGFAPGYIDTARNALAIDATQYKDQFAAASTTFSGTDGTYDVVINTLAELDGESTYNVYVDNVLIGVFQNPSTTVDYAPQSHTFNNIAVTNNAVIRVEFNSHTNGQIPEGNSTAYSRGRWTSLVFKCSDGNTVPIRVTGVNILPDNSSIYVGDTSQLTATVSPSNASNKTVTWTSSNNAIATVNTSGLVTGVASGTVTITATTYDGSFTDTATITVTPNPNGGTCDAQFEEKNNLVVIEAENINPKGLWSNASAVSGFSGTGYMQWGRSEHFNTPGTGLISIKIKINNPGIYLFQWRSKIGHGSSTTDENDSWVRFPDASNNFGSKGGPNSTAKIYPKGSGKTPNPNGVGSNNWWKVYTNTINWNWTSNTSDNDPHAIYVQFDAPGIYTMEISARSKFHFIDRIVLSKGVSNSTSLSHAETPCTGSTISYNITSSAGTGGTISPSGITSVPQGTNRTYTMTPNAGFAISNVIVNGVSQGAISSYTFSNVTAPHTISVTFAAVPTYVITATAGGGGSISPAGATSVAQSANQTYTITANAGFAISDVTVDGMSQGAISSYTFTNVTAAHTINATFAAVPTYAITATAGSGGSISPTGATSVSQGANQTYTITPNAGFVIANVTVNGIPQGAISTYTFTNVTTPHTISASFAAQTETIVFTLINADSDIDLMPLANGTQFQNNDNNAMFNIRVNTTPTVVGSVAMTLSGPATASITEGVAPYALFGDSNGNYHGRQLPVGDYTLSASAYSGANKSGTLIGTRTIQFSVTNSASYNITSSAGTGGSISPAGATSVQQGASQTYTITPNAGFNIANVTVDGMSQGAISTYTFTNVTAAHTISATFEAVSVPTYAITATAGTGGSISPAGATSVQQGASQTYTITANAGFNIADVTVDGMSQGAVSTYTFTNVTAAHTISATFEAVSIPTYAITATAGSGGSISPTGATSVQQGASQTYTITANAGFNIADVTVDGISQGAISTYTFTNVTAAHTISATFAAVSIPTYAITATAGSGGSISPTGATSVQQGASQTYTITANAGFNIANVSVDGIPQGAINTYTFTNVMAVHTISATFAAQTETITFTLINADSDIDLMLLTNGTQFQNNNNAMFNIRANTTPAVVGSIAMSLTGPVTASITEGVAPYALFGDSNGNYHGRQLPVGNYTLSASAYSGANKSGTLLGTRTIQFSVTSLPTYAISATAASGGSISPAGATSVVQGASQAYTITANAGFNIANVTVDGISQGAISAYTFANVTAAHTINATFEALPTYAITATAGGGGSISPEGATSIPQGANQTYTITANAGFNIADVTVDGISQGAISSYTFTNVTAAHTISASFAALPTYAITATAGSGGSISPTGATSIQQGASQTYTITPNVGFTIANVTVDGISQGAISTYTFTNVTAARTISASFAEQTETIVFTLIDADLDIDLMPLANGAQFQNNNNGMFNIRANTTPAVVGSVAMTLSGPVTTSITEGVAPYALFGDSNGNYHGRQLPVGNYTLSASAYSGANKSGTLIGTRTIQFSVGGTGGFGKGDEIKGETLNVSLFPNPASSETSIRLSDSEFELVDITIYDVSGRLIKTYRAEQLRPRGSLYKIDVSEMSEGVYFLNLKTSGTTIFGQRLIIKK